MKAKNLEEFKKQYSVSRTVIWNAKTESFKPRSYSATLIAMETQSAFEKFKLDSLLAPTEPFY